MHRDQQKPVAGLLPGHWRMARFAWLAALAVCLGSTLRAQPLDGRYGSQKHAVINFEDLAREEALKPPAATLLREAPGALGAARPHVGTAAVTASTSSGGRSLDRAFTPGPTAPSPSPTVTFQGLFDNLRFIPPDTHGAVGPNHLMLMHNGTVRIQDRNGVPLSTITLDAFWSPVGPFTDFTFDPKVLYDPFNGRWIVVTCVDGALASSAILIGVSATNNPLGVWNLYRIAADPGGSVWADYPSIGFNKDWIVVSMNMFDILAPRVSGQFNRENVYIFDRTNLYAGAASANFTLRSTPLAFTLVPAITYDTNLSTMYLIEDFDGSTGTLRLYTITGTIGSESLNIAGDITTTDTWDDFPSVDAPQLNSFRTIAINDARIHNLVYRNGSLWTTHTVYLPANQGTHSAVQWWQVSPTGGIVQRGRIEDPTGQKFYAFPSIAVNRKNDAMIGYSSFSSTQFASAAYSVRFGTDPPGTMQSDFTYKAGLGVYYKTFGSGENRWGDYSATMVDPANDLDMWTIQEYAETSIGNGSVDGSGRWGTWWAKLFLATTPDNVLEVSALPVPGSLLQANTTVPFFINVSDTFPVTNAFVRGTIPGLFTNVLFNNGGPSSPPDLLANDEIYSLNVVLPNVTTNIDLIVSVNAAGKFPSTNTFPYTITPAPLNDYFAAAFKAPDAGGILVGNNTFGTIEPFEPVHAGVATVANSVWWYWSPTQSGTVLLDSLGSGFNTVLAVYTGNNITNLTPIASADDVGGRTQGYLFFDAVAGTTYRIAVSGFAPNDFGPIRLRLEFGGLPDTTPPNLTVTSPTSGLITTNGQITFTGTASDPQPNSSGLTAVLLAVGNNAPITATGTTNWTATISLAPGTNVVKVTALDLANNVSTPRNLTITYRVFDPPNDLFINATPLTGFSGLVAVTNLNATAEIGEPLHASKTGGKSVWWTYTPPSDGVLFLISSNSTVDTLMAMYTGPRVNQLTLVAANDDASTNVSYSQISQAVQSGQTYAIAVDGLDGAEGILGLYFSFTPANIYSVIVAISGSGAVTPGSSFYAEGSSAQLVALAATNVDFVTWLGDALTLDNPLQLTVLSNIALTAVFAPHDFADDFETGNLSKLPWQAGTNNAWSVQLTNSTATNFPGGSRYFARSASIGDNQSSTLTLVAGCRAGPASFAYRVSSEEFGTDGDFFDFRLNGTRLVHVSGTNNGWQTYSFNVPAGTNTLQFSYAKGLGQFSAGLDAAFIDNLDLPVTVPKSAASAATISTARVVNGVPQIRLQGQTNQTYHIQASADLFNWQTIATNVAIHGLVQFNDTQATNFPVRFYRAIVP